jgi:hypothetical protein
MRKRLTISLAACAAIVLSGSVLAAENWLGTWKMNPAKSKYSPGPGPKSLMLKWEKTENGIKLDSDGVNSEGTSTHAEYVSRFDGKDVPYTGNPDADAASAKKIDDNHFTNVWKKDGKATISAKAVVSNDGKTLTINLTGTNAKGATVNNIVVYDRQ